MCCPRRTAVVRTGDLRRWETAARGHTSGQHWPLYRRVLWGKKGWPGGTRHIGMRRAPRWVPIAERTAGEALGDWASARGCFGDRASWGGVLLVLEGRWGCRCVDQWRGMVATEVGLGLARGKALGRGPMARKRHWRGKWWLGGCGGYLGG
jgi:hypothetical protein